jgi:ATP-dependent DNA helicase RecQ
VRRDALEAFVRDDIQVVVATVAFGMGINKPDVRWVVHFDLPKSLEAYYQESGRAGRDGDPARCVLYFGAADIRTADYLIQQKLDPQSGAALEDEQRIARQQLRQVLDYAESTECRRAVQLRYFGESFEGSLRRLRQLLRAALGAGLERRGEAIPVMRRAACAARAALRQSAQIIEILRGARSERVLSRGHDTLSVYGIGKHRSLAEWRAVARALLHQALVDETQDGFPVLSLNPESWCLLRGERGVEIAQSPPHGPPRQSGERGDARLRRRCPVRTPARLRKQLAVEQGLPPYVIFHDATLREMALRRPLSIDQFADLPGVGSAKLSRYGRAIHRGTARAFSLRSRYFIIASTVGARPRQSA